MNRDVSNLAAGFLVGAVIGAVLGMLYAPEPEEASHMLKRKIGGTLSPFKRMMFNLKWRSMSPRERYAYLWSHGGSLHDWRTDYQLAETEQPGC